MDFIVELI